MAFLVRYVHGGMRRPCGEREIERALELAGPFQVRRSRGGDEHSHYYQNPDTRVHCRFVTYAPHEAHEVGLDFEMLQPTPTFFAYEALPLAVSVARELRVRVVVVEPHPDSEPFVPSIESLLGYWHEGNRQSVEELVRERQPVALVDAGALECTWEYMTLYPELRRRYGRNSLQVPAVRLLQSTHSQEVYRWVEWKGMGPIVMPEVDLVELVHPPAPLVDGHIYAAEELVEACRPHIRDVSQPIFHRLFDRGSLPAAVIDAVAELPSKTMRSFREVDFDQVTDAPLPQVSEHEQGGRAAAHEPGRGRGRSRTAQATEAEAGETPRPRGRSHAASAPENEASEAPRPRRRSRASS